MICHQKSFVGLAKGSEIYPGPLATSWCIHSWCASCKYEHYSDVIMSAMASQITSIWTVWSTVCSGAHQRKHQIFVSLAFVREIHRWPVDFPHKGSVTWKMLSFDDVIMIKRHFHEFWVTCVKGVTSTITKERQAENDYQIKRRRHEGMPF